MRRSISTVLLLAIISVASAKNILADVTGDGIDDIIRMGMKMVTVQDGASNRLHTIVAGKQFLADISVDDYFSGTRGNEIAISMLPEKGYFSEVYGYRNKRFIRVAENLPGELSFDEDRRLFGYAVHEWNRNEILIYWPLIEDEGHLKAASVVQMTDTSLFVTAKETEEFKFDLYESTFTMCVVSTLDDNVIVFLSDEDGALIKQNVIDPQTGFYGRVIAEQAKAVTLNIDNLQSTKPKTVHVTIKQYAYP
jgi:hypothetical protein